MMAAGTGMMMMNPMSMFPMLLAGASFTKVRLLVRHELSIYKLFVFRVSCLLSWLVSLSTTLAVMGMVIIGGSTGRTMARLVLWWPPVQIWC